MTEILSTPNELTHIVFIKRCSKRCSASEILQLLFVLHTTAVLLYLSLLFLLSLIFRFYYILYKFITQKTALLHGRYFPIIFCIVARFYPIIPYFEYIKFRSHTKCHRQRGQLYNHNSRCSSEAENSSRKLSKERCRILSDTLSKVVYFSFKNENSGLHFHYYIPDSC